MLRNAPELAPGDSLHRFAQLMRFEPVGVLSVTEHGRLAGIMSPSDVVPVLAIVDTDARATTMQRPVSDFMRPPQAVLRSTMSMEEIGRVFAESRQPILPVLDERDYYLGAVYANDLLVPDLPAPRPTRIGGMATPFGVYLTDGTVQAGVGNLALFTSGVMMTGLWLAAFAGMGVVFSGISFLLRRSVPLLLSFGFGDEIPFRNPWLGLASVGESVLLFLVFICLMRLTRLAGFHAAEHQTVHAIERFEPLVSSVVRRMPRAHPRCGTNLMAAVLVFMTVRQVLVYVPWLSGLPDIMAAATTLFVWRPVGTFLQERFTTKPADEREIQSGIRAGQGLLDRYRNSAPVRPSLSRRIWCSGMLQIMLGAAPCWLLIYFLAPYIEPLRRLFGPH